MKYLITGVSGQLGKEIYNELIYMGEKSVVGFSSKELDIRDKKKVDKIISFYKPDYVFHCAAYTNVNKANEESNKCIDVNVDGTENVLNASKKVNAKFMYISTDYVFDGYKKTPYKEIDDCMPNNVYGYSKFYGEEIVKKYSKSFIVRVSWLYDTEGNNFANKMLELAKEKDELNIVCDQIGTPTYIKHLVPLLIDIMKSDKYGIYHAGNSGYTNWADFARYIFKCNDIDIKVNDITSKELKQKVVRPLNSCLDKTKLINKGFYELPSWEKGVEDYSLELKLNKGKVMVK